MALTCTYAKRNSQFLQTCRDTLLAHWHDMYNEFAFSHEYFDRHNDDREYEPIVLPAVLLKCAMSRYDVKMRRPKCYGDDMPMVAFKLSDIRRHEGVPYYPSFSELHMRMTLAKTIGTNARMVAPPVATKAPTVDRSAAARKAIETRRKRAAQHV